MNIETLRSCVVVLALGLSFLPAISARAQQPAKVFRIGLLNISEPRVFINVLKELGYVEGQNVVFDFRDTQAQPQRAREQAADLVLRKVDVIVAFTNLNAFAAKQATSTTPIVVWAAHGALATGLVSSLARPGGNVTGTESLAPELDTKRVELLKEIVPGLARVAALYNADDQGSPTHLKYAQDAARAFGIRVMPVEVRIATDFDSAFSALAANSVGGLVMFTDNLTFTNWKRVADFTRTNRVPTVCEFRQLAEAGCLVSYGPTFAEFNQRVASQVDRILKGIKPADVPFEQPTRFELVVNLKTAKALGVTIPRSVLVRADAVIE